MQIHEKLLQNTFIVFFSIFFVVTNCSVISKDLKREIDQTITLQDLEEEIDNYIGKTVLFGGDIIETVNLENETIIEILQKPLGYRDQPKYTDNSEGRFLAVAEGFLDGSIYEKGREVTIVGKVTGERKKPLNEFQYTYPVIKVIELHLWDKRPKYIFHYEPYPSPYNY